MRIIRFISGGKEHLGRPIDARSAHRLDGALFEDLTVTADVLPIDQLLPPLVPRDILCIGLNYRDHAAEGGFELPKHPMLFIKASNTLIASGDSIRMPARSSMIDYEGELAVVIGKTATAVSRADALQHVFGYTIANDVTARDWQRDKSLGGGQFCRAKSFDSFCPMGPAIVTADEVHDPQKLNVRTILNGQTMQDGNTADMIFDVAALIESLSSTMTLFPGTVILTGTPAGVGFARKPPVWMKVGDTVEITIEPIGTLSNTIGR